MYYTEKPGHLARVVDITATRSTKDGAALLQIFVEDTIISAITNRDPAIRHALIQTPLTRRLSECSSNSPS